MDQQVGNFFVLAVCGEIGDIVSAIVQIVAAVTDRTDGRIARGRT